MMSIPELLLFSIGFLLIWAAIKNKNPLTTVKDVLTNKTTGS